MNFIGLRCTFRAYFEVRELVCFNFNNVVSKIWTRAYLEYLGIDSEQSTANREDPQDKLQDLIKDYKKKDISIVLSRSVVSDIRTTNEDIFVPSKNVLLNNRIKDIQLTNGNIINNF